MHEDGIDLGVGREPRPTMKLRLLKKEPEPEPEQEPKSEPDGKQEPEKICVDCELPLALSSFYTNAASKDGRQSRCKSCDNKRRAEYNHPEDARARRPAAEVAGPVERATYSYEGISGGFLIYGYVR
jgi:hypothetical protein